MLKRYYVRATCIFRDENTNTTDEWYYEDGLTNYLVETIGNSERIPEGPFIGSFASKNEAVDWARFGYPMAAKFSVKVMST